MIRFTKMHGLGNDFVCVNGHEEQVRDPAALSRAVSDRHFGVGSDGLVLILPSNRADVRMRIFNADGSEAEMCGNAIRCLAKYVYDRGIVRKDELTVQTLAGTKSLQLRAEDGRVKQVRADMGRPRLTRGEIPMTGPPADDALNVPLTVEGGVLSATCVNLGNPHAVIFVDDVASVALERLGPRIEKHPLFPERVNVHFAQVINAGEVSMRTWERGSGVTLACGTGASAVCVAGVVAARTERRIVAHVAGGGLDLEWEQDGNVTMTGPAAEVFSGVWPG